MGNFQAKTIGNATLIIKNKKSTILVTDPWFHEHSCYYGSWSLTHEVPNDIKEEALKTKYVFISHFHPDHLNLQTLKLFKSNSKIILAKHFSNRLSTELRKFGFDVIVMPNRKWIELEEGLKIITFSDEKQDSTLLLEICHGTEKSLIVNLNDSNGCGSKGEIREISKNYKNSILLQLASYGDANMINLWEYETSKKIKSPCDDFSPIGRIYEKSMKDFDCDICIPFSSSHQYQRSDSWWARKYGCIEDDHFKGFKQTNKNLLLPFFQSISFADNKQELDFKNINPNKITINEPIDPTLFGDNWKDGMKDNDKDIIYEYFSSIDYLKTVYDSISVRFNQDIFCCNLNNIKRHKKNILFHSPRNSFMHAIKNNVFDDLLIGNFMKTYLSGIKNLRYPNFGLYVAKLSDNAYVKTKKDIDAAFAFYNQDRIIKDKFAGSLGRVSSLIKDNIFSPPIRTFFKKLF